MMTVFFTDAHCAMPVQRGVILLMRQARPQILLRSGQMVPAHSLG